MYCPKCGTQNPDDAQLCSSCSAVLTAAAGPAPDPKTSGLATTSLVLALLSILCSVFTAIPAVILGITALKKINKSPDHLKGKGLAIAGITVAAVMLLIFVLYILILVPALSKSKTLAYRLICATNMKGLGKAMEIYGDNYDDKYPTSSKWCDLLIQSCKVTTKQFVCMSSDAIQGECSYAMNENLADKKRAEIPPDVVVLFETNLGKNASGRQELYRNRDWHKLRYGQHGHKTALASKKVYKLRWNQAGGQEILTTENHQREGSNILFADGRVEFVGNNDIGNLRWEVQKER